MIHDRTKARPTMLIDKSAERKVQRYDIAKYGRTILELPYEAVILCAGTHGSQPYIAALVPAWQTDGKTTSRAFHVLHEKESWVPPPGARLISITGTDYAFVFIEDATDDEQ